MQTVASHSVAAVGKSSVTKEISTQLSRSAATTGLVEILGLSFGYASSDHYVLKSLNLKVEPGEAISLLGPSGCGKSTLLHLIAGLNSPQGGRIHLDGDLISKP